MLRSLAVYVVVYLVVYPVTLYYLLPLCGWARRVTESEAAAPTKVTARLRARRGGRGCGASNDSAARFVPLWTMILGFGVFMYVLMDGFDLGVGILFRRAPSDEARDIMMNSVAPIWDGNETWLVLGGLGLLAAFPLAFAIILPALYFPILIMLIALIFAVSPSSSASRPPRHRGHRWDAAFHYGSLVATLAQGFVLGAFVPGISCARSLLRRGRVRLAAAVQRLDGDQPGARLWAAGCDLADHEDRRQLAGLGSRAGAGLLIGVFAMGGGEPMDAVSRSGSMDRCSPGRT